MASVLKSIIRKAFRLYISNTPIKKGRYPLMMLAQKLTSEPITLEVLTKDRGRMILDLDDSAQFPLYYNIYEWRDTPTLSIVASGSRTILDIGGNIGQMALFFAQFAKTVHTFEPIPAKAKRLQEQIILNKLNNKVQLCPLALSNTKGSLRFAMPKAGNGGTGSTVIMDEAASDIIEVQTITLDEYITTNSIKDIDLIKMDIEGAELFALNGMTNLLSSPNKPILILEMTLSMMKKAGYSPDDLVSFLGQFGYDCFEFTYQGLRGPVKEVFPASENYCFLTKEHTLRPKISSLIKKQ